jgi:Ankyrin repeats (3 copies)/Ankyrin repeat
MKKTICQLGLFMLMVIVFIGCTNPHLETIIYANRNLTDAQRRDLSKSCFLAIQRGQEDVAIMIIKQGAYLNWREQDEGWTLLISAIYFEEDDIAEYLIDCGADVNLTDYAARTPLIWTAIRDNEDIAEKLVENGAVIDAIDFKKQNAIHYATIHDADYVAEYLLEVQSMRYRRRLKEQNEALKRRIDLESKLAQAEITKAEKAGKRMRESKKLNRIKKKNPVKKAVPSKDLIQGKVKKPVKTKPLKVKIPVSK